MPASLSIRRLSDLNEQLLFTRIRLESVLVEIQIFLSAPVAASFQKTAAIHAFWSKLAWGTGHTLRVERPCKR